jgi:hypothetical protein
MGDLNQLGRQRIRLLEQLADVTAKIETLAVAEVDAGEPKRQVAMRAGVTRPTIDAWLRDAERAERELR